MKTTMIAVALVCAGVAVAGRQPPAPAKAPDPAKIDPPATPAPKPPPAAPPVPTLDESLGLAKPASRPGPTEGKPTVPPDLERALNGEQEGNELERAVALMDESARRLGDEKDATIATQRVQEETVRLLDALVKKGNQKKNPQSKQQSRQQKQEQQQQPSQSQQSQQQQQQQQQQNPGQDTSPSVERGGTTDARMRPGIDAARAAWGNLPQRVRQLLMQGSGDQFSKEYQRLTEEYYKRLGEGGGAPGGWR
ncbi:MAG: hypothetical protein K2Q09_06695 [Phycisphaerales bacterium]|nr:hypothetical protein [Phycisphaerales bacterium]